MTIGGALSDLNNLLNADDIPFYYKPSIKAVMDTIALDSFEIPTGSTTKREQVKKCENCAKEISAECVVDGCKFEPKQGEKNCRNCGQPRDYKGRCIPFIEGKCIKVRTGWIPKQTDDTDIDDGSIKVGDEIYSDETDMTAVVHHIDAWGRYQCFNENGAQFVLDKGTYDEYWHKTYKYYPQIAEVLKQLRGENE